MGNEHTPEPHPFVKFPIFNAELIDSIAKGDDLRLSFRLHLCGTDDYKRYRVLFKVQIVNPGEGKNPGKMRNYISHDVALSDTSEVSINVKCEMPPTGNDSQSYGIYIRYLLIDNVTGYRSQYRSYNHPI